MATPVALKLAIETIMKHDYKIKIGCSPIYLNADFESSRRPLWQSPPSQFIF
jgi:hypothetical protein